MRGDRDEDLTQEIKAHLEMAARERMERGESAADAVAGARREFGNVALVSEVTRATWPGGGFERLVQDAQYGLRLLRRNGSFSLIAILTLALGIGAATAIFSVVYGVLLRPLPYPHPESLVQLREAQLASPSRPAFAEPNFIDLRAQNHSLAVVAEYESETETVQTGTEPLRLAQATVSADFFRVLAVEPALGRTFGAEDQRPGAAPAALIGDGLWRSLGAPRDLSGLHLGVEHQSFAVIGVMPAGFDFPDHSQLWLPRELTPPETSRTAHNWNVVGRLAPGVTLAQARAELSAIGHRLKQSYGQDIWLEDIDVTGLRDLLTDTARAPLVMLMAAVSLLLLIGCANVANLQLAQASAREGEIAVRIALGAGPGRLLRQFLVESLLLSLAGGILGVLIAVWGVRWLKALAPADLPRVGDIGIDFRVLAFAFLVAVLVGALLGVFTARRARASEPRGGLVSGSAAVAGTTRRQRLGMLLVTIQIGLTLVLLVGAGLLGRSLLSVLSINPGFRTEQIIGMTIALPSITNDQERSRRIEFFNRLFAEIGRLPGVQVAAGVTKLPLAERLANGTFLRMAPGEKVGSMDALAALFKVKARTGDASLCKTSPGYFQALGIPMLAGRLLEDRDTYDAPNVAVVSARMAREAWPHQDPLGRVIEFGNMDGDLRPLTVVGVVGDVRSTKLEKEPEAIVYVNAVQRPSWIYNFTIIARASGDPKALAGAARRVLHDLDPTIPPSFDTFEEVFSRSLAARRFNLTLIMLFAGTALLLALAGVYGVMGYAVARRKREVGVRMALGARPASVLALIVGEGLTATLMGVVLGLVSSIALTQALASQLYGVGAIDPLTLAAVAVLLAAAATVASYIPARRATRIDPLLALRSD